MMRLWKYFRHHDQCESTKFNSSNSWQGFSTFYAGQTIDCVSVFRGSETRSTLIEFLVDTLSGVAYVFQNGVELGET